MDEFRPSEVTPGRVDVSFADRVVELAVVTLFEGAGLVATLLAIAVLDEWIGSLTILGVGLAITGLASGTTLGWLAAPPERPTAAVIAHALLPIGLGSFAVWLLHFGLVILAFEPGGALGVVLASIPFAVYVVAFALLGVWLVRLRLVRQNASGPP